jgi:hypothetical protein
MVCTAGTAALSSSQAWATQSMGLMRAAKAMTTASRSTAAMCSIRPAGAGAVSAPKRSAIASMIRVGVMTLRTGRCASQCNVYSRCYTATSSLRECSSATDIRGRASGPARQSSGGASCTPGIGSRTHRSARRMSRLPHWVHATHFAHLPLASKRGPSAGRVGHDPMRHTRTDTGCGRRSKATVQRYERRLRGTKRYEGVRTL